jgi:hypothetical protein
VLAGKPEDKIPCGRLGTCRESTLKLTLDEYGMKVWIGCTWVRIGLSGGLVNKVVKLTVPLKAKVFFISWATVTFKKDFAPWS